MHSIAVAAPDVRDRAGILAKALGPYLPAGLRWFAPSITKGVLVALDALPEAPTPRMLAAAADVINSHRGDPGYTSEHLAATVWETMIAERRLGLIDG